MELKVRVEGFSRVVCGVTEQTTCQEVVIALAHAMGRTGRFTLIEKWRDNERPLLPTDCPIQVLNKWGEYASEVQLLLHQSDKNMSTDVENIPEQVNSKDKFSHNFTPPVKDKGTEIRRVLTFSGAHNSVAPSAKRKMVKQISTPNHMQGYHGKYKDQMYSGTISENSEMFSTNRDIDPHPTNTASAYYNIQSNGIDQIHPAFRGRSGNELPKQLHTYNDQTLGMNGDIPHRRNDVALNSHRKSPYLVNNSQNVKYPTDQNIRPNPNSAHSYMNAPDPSAYQQGQTGRQKNVNTNSSKQNYMSNVNPQRTEYSQSRGASLEPNNRDQNHYRINSRESPRDNGFKSSVLHSNMVIPPQPETHLHPNKSILPVVQNKTRNSAFQPVVSQKNGPELYHDAAVNGDINLPVYNRFPVHNEAEEYDLDSNFPDVRPGQRKKPVLIEEYRMPGDGHRDQELVQADRQGIPDPELTKMQRLITSQQERIKIQESQIQEIESEIGVLEDKEMEDNQQLSEINKQITQLDKKNSELEVEISDLDSTKWVDLVESEKNAEKRLQAEIADYQTKLTQKDTEIQSQSDKCSELESDITTEKSELEVEKKRVQEEEEKLNSDLQELKEELDSKDEQLEKDKKSLEEVEDELRTLVDRLTIQQQEVDSLEQELKTVNMEEFQLSPAPIRKEIKKNDSGEVVLKMLEGRVSPALGLNRKIIVSPISKVLSVSKNPNGVWV